MSTVAVKKAKPRNWLQRIFRPGERRGANAPNPIFIQLAGGLEQYRMTWAALPQTKISAGPPLKRAAKGKRVDLLRTRLGLAPGVGYDYRLVERVEEYQRVHRLGAVDGVAGKATIASLNLGTEHYARRLEINVERDWRLPTTGTFNRCVVVDSASAAALLFDRERVADTMRVVVGSPKTKTPMMAVILRNAKANPYWNVPPELVRSLTAKRVLEQGPSYIDNFHYEVLSGWTADARLLDPKEVDWKLVAAGKRPDLHVRQKPGPWNSMGAMKFEMPNDYGIYLHDTPHKELFDQDDRWLSNGCVRLQDYRRFASWVFGRPPQSTGQLEQVIELSKP